jgi:hypothetical protein
MRGHLLIVAAFEFGLTFWDSKAKSFSVFAIEECAVNPYGLVAGAVDGLPLAIC